MKKELILACGLFLALPLGQGFAETSPVQAAEQRMAAALNQKGLGQNEMKAASFNEDEATYFEEEPNNVMGKATYSEVNYYLSGTIHNQVSNNGKDVDYFKFSVAENEEYSLLSLMVNEDEINEETSRVMKVRLLDASGKKIAESELLEDEEGGGLQYLDASLAPGTYYIEVTNPFSTDLNEDYLIVHSIGYEEEPIETTFERISGKDRYETAVKLSQDGWGDESSEYAVIATGSNFPDALSATPLAYRVGGPLLLTTPNTLPNTVKKELIRLGVKKVYLVGGKGAISDTVKTQLEKMKITVTRLSGTDRFETSVKIAEEIGTYGTVVVATGKTFADALSIAPIAAQMEMPILLANKDSIPASVTSYMKSWEADKTYVIGGTGAISDATAKKLPGMKRISGKDRYETNSRIIDQFADEINPFYTYLATGTNYPDALAGSALAAMSFSPVVLTDPKQANAATKTTVQKYMDSTAVYYIIGGEKALPQNAIDQLFE
ncbi:cell wall-binding repeat-containing protein [Metabacillus idriensis]|uniref:cell wall-binding repeat-containing protein n=1 Tax=Metabacillus idriensis TaxID=324768 RepID=UPI0028132552|nr:cell wall-binding repeat-containing protein [Metabacillus idriensis]MDR0136817.1 cell wall-binding repeat-containing protein [Metabacillus idriensis]